MIHSNIKKYYGSWLNSSLFVNQEDVKDEEFGVQIQKEKETYEEKLKELELEVNSLTQFLVNS